MQKNKTPIPSRFVLTILMILCVILLFAGYSAGFSGGPFATVISTVFVPMQKGMTWTANRVSVTQADAQSREALVEENERLTQEMEELRMQLSEALQEQSELTRLRDLFALSETYSNYETTGAHVIAGSTSGWFSTFVIDKGTADGLSEDMNVIAGGGLCGIITEAGKHYSTVRAIIDDDARISAMIQKTGDHCIVSGNLKDMMTDQLIRFSSLKDDFDSIHSGDAIVTSNISDKFLPGLLVGYIVTFEQDANQLTKSGTIAPVVDFRHLREVLVILQVKETEDPE